MIVTSLHILHLLNVTHDRPDEACIFESWDIFLGAYVRLDFWHFGSKLSIFKTQNFPKLRQISLKLSKNFTKTQTFGN